MDEFKQYSYGIQNIHFQFLEGKEYNVLLSHELHHFKTIVQKYMEKTEELCKIISKSRILYYQIILVNCNWEDKMFTVPVIRIKQNENVILYDYACRKYKDWEDFLSHNILPRCVMMFPPNGVYTSEGGTVKLDERKSPAFSGMSTFTEYMYIGAKAISVFALAASDFKGLKPYNNALIAVSGVCNFYMTAVDGYEIYDCARHGQSISSPEALKSWINIGSNLLFFAVTVGKCKFGSPQPDTIAYQNLLSMCKSMTVGGDIMSNLDYIQVNLLCQHLSFFEDRAVEFLEREVIPSNLNLKLVIQYIRMYILQDDGMKSKFRRFVKVDCNTVSRVTKDMMLASEIPRLFRSDLYVFIIDLDKIVAKIMAEVKNWANGNSSTMQLKFRLPGICRESKSYETIAEMCEHFNVMFPEEIKVNDKFIFKGTGEKFLQLLDVFDNEKFPQLLSYAVEYLSTGKDDLEEFKKQFTDSLSQAICSSIPMMARSSEKEWINVLTLENLDYTHSVPQDGINLVKPKFQDGMDISFTDLFKLAKRLLGRVGVIEMSFYGPNIDWVVVASRKCKYVVIIAPKITNFETVDGCYPVFKRPFVTC